MKHALSRLIGSILQDMGVAEPVVEITVPDDPAHGDYTTNVAMILGKTRKKPPMEFALSVKERLTSHVSRFTSEHSDQKIGKRGQKVSGKKAEENILSAIDRIEVVPPGFINVFLTEASLITQMQRLLKSAEAAPSMSLRPRAKRRGSNLIQKGIAAVAEDGSLAMTKKRIMVEFAHPNTHKAFHIGHLRNITTGESIVRLLESQGHTVIRTNYQGDVGMHIAKALWALLRIANRKSQIAKLKTHTERVEFLGKAYAAGAKAYEEDEAAKQEIGEINKKIYAKDPGIYPLYEETRQWSLDYFDAIYKRVGSRFDRLYFESEVYEPGKKLVHNGVKKGIFEESDGAVIFPGKKYGLHNRVFVTGEGNATYEGKELALAAMETTEFGKINRLIHVVGPEQASFFQVTFKAEELLGIVKPGVQHHLIYGWVKLKHGKMSSRSGNVVFGDWLLDEAKKEIYSILQKSNTKDTTFVSSPRRRGSSLSSIQKEEIAEKAAIAAVKYAFLKVSTQQEIAFDMGTSVSFDGDSGPYLQYTYARCRSVLRKAGNDVIARSPASRDDEAIPSSQGIAAVAPSTRGSLAMTLNPEERAVARLLVQFPDVVAQAADAFSPSTLCRYLFTLAQAFNMFYAKHPILGSSLRLALTAATAQVLKNGLYLLGIEVLEKM